MANENVPEVTGDASYMGVITGELSPVAGTDLSGELSVPASYEEHYVLPPATTGTLGGIIVGEDLLITEEGVLSIDKATSVEGDNTRPITAAAVYTEVGNINALLATI